jgi:hypothetical protein
MNQLRKLFRYFERGDAESISFLTAVPVLVALLTMVAAGAYALPVRPMVWSAARECARAASATLDEGLGVAQGIRAAEAVLGGANDRRGNWTVNITHDGPFWARGVNVTCSVTYSVDMSGFTVSGFFAPPNALTLTSQVTLRIEPFKSRWSYIAPAGEALA